MKASNDLLFESFGKIKVIDINYQIRFAFKYILLIIKKYTEETLLILNLNKFSKIDGVTKAMPR